MNLDRAGLLKLIAQRGWRAHLAGRNRCGYLLGGLCKPLFMHRHYERSNSKVLSSMALKEARSSEPASVLDKVFMAPKLERITYVEDEPDIRSVTEFALTELGGFSLDVCASGPEALARTPGFNPHLIIMDVMMPGMDGIETFKRLREIPTLAETPVVFMTAKAMKHEIDRYLALGAADVIAKPFDPLTLSERVQEIWQQARATRRAAS